MRTLILITLFFSTTVVADIKTDIPNNAIKYIPVVIKEVKETVPGFPLPPYFMALIEHESCVSLKSKRCWSPKSELRTKREQGVGLGQITRAWKNGKLRFDTLADLVRRYPHKLGKLSWANVKNRPDLQIRALVLLYNDNYKKLNPDNIPSITERLAFADIAYNGGYKRVYNDRRACGLARGCDPTKYFNNVERYCTASKRKLYGNRSACDINRHHVRDVFGNRLHKYVKYYLQKIE